MVGLALGFMGAGSEILRTEGGVTPSGFDPFGGWVVCVAQVGLDNRGGVHNPTNAS